MPSTCPEPVAQELLEFWNVLDSRRTDWALRAYDRMVNTLSPDMQHRLRRKDQPTESYVVIFGKTQVGKTTLLLDLMGVDPQRIAAVSKVLRGGRALGQSATATAMEYCRSVDQRWGLSVNSDTQWFDSEDEITTGLGDLRKEMEAQKLHTSQPCVVHIPSGFFLASCDTAPQVRMLDLPGDNPANAAEQAHVNEMARVYVPFADLIILVGRGDDLGFLRPEGITLPGIGDWQRIPSKFRVVTTFSYSAQSVRDRIRADAGVDAAAMRKRLRQEIERFGSLSKAARELDLFFPLEFGTSWTSVREHEPALYARMAPVICELRSELLEQIAGATSPMGRLRNTLSTHQGIETLQNEREQAAAHTLENVCGGIRVLDADIASCDSKIASLKKAVARLKQRNAGAKEANQLIHAAKQAPDFPPAATYPEMHMFENAKDVSDFKVIIDKCSLALRHVHLAPAAAQLRSGIYWSLVHKRVVAPEISNIESLLSEALGGIRARLDDYWFDIYMRKQVFKRDRQAVFLGCEAAKHAVLNSHAKAWNAAAEEVSAQLQKELSAAENERNTFRLERISLRRQLRVCRKKAEQVNAELERIQEDGAQDQARCRALADLLDEEYLATLSDQLDAILTGDDECKALLQLLSCHELSRQRRELLNMNAKEGARNHGFAG